MDLKSFRANPVQLYVLNNYIILKVTLPQAVEETLDTLPLTIGGVRKWVWFSAGLKISKSSVCAVRDKCKLKTLAKGAGEVIPILKTEKERAVLEAFEAMGVFSDHSEPVDSGAPDPGEAAAHTGGDPEELAPWRAAALYYPVRSPDP